MAGILPSEPPPTTATKDRATANDLPDEVLLEILSYIPKTETKTLWSLTVASTRLNVICEPSLYHTFHYSRQVKNSAWTFLLRIIHRPQLATYVNDVSLQNWQNWRSSPGPLLKFINSKSQASLLSAADQFGFSPELTRAWKDDLKENMDDAKFALLLLLTPNIEALRLALPSHVPNHHPSWLLRLLNSAAINDDGGRLHGFKALRSLHITDDLGGIIAFGPLKPLISLPTLATFSACNCIEQEDLESWDDLKGTSNIESITFVNSDLTRGDALNRIMRACKTLRLIHFGWVRLASGWYAAPGHNYAGLEAMLQPHQQSLENLKITFEEFWTGSRWVMSDRPFFSSFQTLRQFSNLKYINMPMNLLLADRISIHAMNQGDLFHLTNLLPVSLETLVFNSWNAHLGDGKDHTIYHMQCLGLHSLDMVPNLRLIEIHYSESEEDLYGLLGLFDVRGVNLCLIRREAPS